MIYKNIDFLSIKIILLQIKSKTQPLILINGCV
jgi:hypothetical protein